MDVTLDSAAELVVVEPTSRLLVQPAYEKYDAAYSHVLARADVYHRLRKAAKLLPDDIFLVVADVWRPARLQKALWDEYHVQLRADHPDLAEEDLVALTNTFVSPPGPGAQHLTGGSADVLLADKDGDLLDMGAAYDELTERSATDHYEHATAEHEIVFRDRRRLLAAVMVHVGFSNYPHEFWHFDCGNAWHHARVGGPVRFGPVFDPPAHLTFSLDRRDR